ncbi:TPT-domain-containing protein [Punctularia strigosozonata HHB-11173 SS5]|uniref:TPT-domain-containing protein n=1 Tax=Punctularia strigosozonata (strain HHB-11173) TaxID=741275 RepID=UPI000441847B|nr:TPT-domain-containing protein [Punctularia strigosozonata HHB-11173 SS5]EIN14509.1 TPT-domain-containing protein [Punctularia strigosozonata HHB-11173 SS5]
MWLAMYFILNLTLTLHNKAVLVDLPYPYVLTAVHSLCSTLGALIMRRKGFYTPSRLGLRENVLLLAFSTLYSLNVAVSNVSLKMVSVPFHQVVRSTTPAFVLMLSYWFLHSTWGRSQLISLLLVITGVTIATFGDYSCTLAGFVLTLIGTFLAALKALMTGLIQSRQSDKPDIAPQSNRPCCVESLRLGLHPYDLLARMSPLALVQCLCYAHYSGELIHVAENASYGTVIILLANGIIAFALNVVSFTANKKTSALSMTVAANVKQVLTIMLAVFIFGLSISPLNIIGIAVTLLGGACYAWAQLCERTYCIAIPILGM